MWGSQSYGDYDITAFSWTHPRLLTTDQVQIVFNLKVKKGLQKVNNIFGLQLYKKSLIIAFDSDLFYPLLYPIIKNLKFDEKVC